MKSGMKIGRRPTKIVALIRDDGARWDVDDIHQIARYVERLERQWTLYALGMNYPKVNAMLDALPSYRAEKMSETNKVNASKPRKKATKKLTQQGVLKFMQEWQVRYPGKRGKGKAAAVEFNVSEKKIRDILKA